MVLGGEGADVKSAIIASNDNDLILQDLKLDEIDSMPHLGEVVGKGTGMYLVKSIVPENAASLKVELQQLQELAQKCNKLGMVLGELYLPLQRRMEIVQNEVMRIQDEVQERFYNMQVLQEEASMSGQAASDMHGSVRQHAHAPHGTMPSPVTAVRGAHATAASGRSIALTPRRG